MGLVSYYIGSDPQTYAKKYEKVKLLEMDTNPNKMLNEKSWLDSYNLNRNNFMKTGTDELIQVEIVEDRVQNEYADIIDF